MPSDNATQSANNRRGLFPDGKKIRELRERRGLTQEKLAVATGLAKRTIESAEKGKTRKRPLETLRLIAKHLDVDVSELIRAEPQACTVDLPPPLPSDSFFGRGAELKGARRCVGGGHLSRRHRRRWMGNGKIGVDKRVAEADGESQVPVAPKGFSDGRFAVRGFGKTGHATQLLSSGLDLL